MESGEAPAAVANANANANSRDGERQVASPSVNHFASRRSLSAQGSGSFAAGVAADAAAAAAGAHLRRGLSRGGTVQFEDGTTIERPQILPNDTTTLAPLTKIKEEDVSTQASSDALSNETPCTSPSTSTSTSTSASAPGSPGPGPGSGDSDGLSSSPSPSPSPRPRPGSSPGPSSSPSSSTDQGSRDPGPAPNPTSNPTSSPSPTPTPSPESSSLGVIAELVEEDLPLKSGWLLKERPGLCKYFQRRWFVLGRKQLRWYKKPEDKVPAGVIDFDLVPCEVGCDKGNHSPEAPAPSCSSLLRRGRTAEAGSCADFLRCLPEDTFAGSFHISPKDFERTFSLRAADSEDRSAWITALQRHIQLACLDTMTASSALTGTWWKVDRISPDKFSDMVETGDVLLFRSLGAAPQLIRTFSHGNWDHVALLVRLADRQVGLLEATGGEGVGLVLWEEFLENGWEQLYPSLALRKVKFSRTKAKLNALQKWITTVLGKPYGLTIQKLMQRKSFSEGGEVNDDAFFCSQLVAEGLKVLEVIPRGISSTQFWPATFAAEQTPPIVTMEGTDLQQQFLIDFNLGPESKATKDGPKKERDATTAWK